MCGVSGFWVKHFVNADELARAMAASLAHRGPDGEGHWTDREAGIALSHRRLAIIDLSDTGAQPMRSRSGRYVISYNGELYNYRLLREQLAANGQLPALAGSGDTAVLLAAIEAWGLTEALTRAVGMFAFALFDRTERTLSLVRDRLGVKPLLYTRTPEGLAFASELQALERFPGFDARISPAALAGYFAWGAVPGDTCMLTGGEKVPPGAVVTFRAPDAAPTVKPYFELRAEVAAAAEDRFTGSVDDATRQLEELLDDAVRLRLVSDVPLGAALSGGLDSAAVVATMCKVAGGPVHTFSLGNTDPAFDESASAQAMAAHFGTEHHPLVATAGEALQLIPTLASQVDEPIGDSSLIPTTLVARLARGSVTVLLTGDGGDELFGGYVRHVALPRLVRIQRLVPRGMRRATAGLLRSVPPSWWDALARAASRVVPLPRLMGLRLHKLADALEAGSFEEAYRHLAGHWRTEDGLLAYDVAQAAADVAETQTAPPHSLVTGLAVPGLAVSERGMVADLAGYLPDDVLTKVDRATMSVGLEARSPFLDHRLLRFALRLPAQWKVRGSSGKWLLRRAFAPALPKRHTSSPKLGFGIPLAGWLKGPLRPWAEELLSEKRLAREGYVNHRVVARRWREFLRGERPWEYHLWDVLMLEAWLAARQPGASLRSP